MNSKFGILLLAIALQRAPQNGTGILEGTVHEVDTTTPVAGVSIHIRDDGRFTADTTTDNGGHFIFREVPSGSIAIEFSRPGYSAPNGARTNQTRISVRPNALTEASNLTLVQLSTIRGLITDSEERPVAGAGVEILSLSLDERGRKTWGRVSPPIQADRYGVFEGNPMRPGEYYVRVVSGKPHEPGIAVFFPGTLNPNAAVKVMARAGETIVTNIRIPPMETATFKVSGRVSHVLTRTASSPSIGLTLIQHDPGAPAAADNTVPATAARTIMNEDTGRFEFRGIHPGSYDLFTTVSAGGKSYLSKTTVEVRDGDVDNVDAVIRPGVDMKVRLTSDNTTDEFQFLRNLSSVLRSPSPRARAQVQVTVTRKDGYPYRPELVIDDRGTSATFPNLPEGDYEVSAQIGGGPRGSNLLPNNADLYIADVRIGGRSVYAGGIRVGLDPVDNVEVLIGTNGGTLGGAVVGKGRDSVRIILVPDSFRRNNPWLYRMEYLFTKDESGQFRIRGIAPGTYKVFAVPADDPAPFRSPEFAAEHEIRAVEVEIRPGLMTTVPVPLHRPN